MSKMTKKKEINLEIEFDISSLSVEDIVAWLEANYGNINIEKAGSAVTVDYEKDRMKKGLIDNFNFFIKEGNRKMSITTYFAITGHSYNECEKYVDSILEVDILKEFFEVVYPDKDKTFTKSKTLKGVFDLPEKK